MIDLQPACQGMIDVLTGVTEDQLGGDTPCSDYSVGDLIDHVDQVARLFTALAQHDTDAMGGVAVDPDAAHLGPHWFDHISQGVRILGEAWGDPEAWQGSTGLAGPDLSNEQWGRITLTELVVHGWDIATATGQPFGLPEPTLRACLDHVAVFVPNAPVPDLWGTSVEVAPDAARLDRIVGITGRVPS